MQTRKITITTHLIISCVFAWLPYATHAAEAPPAPEESETTTESAPSAPSTGSERRRAGDKGGIFRPTEDISEDVAITFPVDI